MLSEEEYNYMADPQAGLFIFSLDTELGTGYFDKDRERAQMSVSYTHLTLPTIYSV